MTEMYIPTFDDVAEAHERIKPYIHRTRVFSTT
jgi:threonine dehydratase